MKSKKLKRKDIVARQKGKLKTFDRVGEIFR